MIPKKKDDIDTVYGFLSFIFMVCIYASGVTLEYVPLGGIIVFISLNIIRHV